MSHPQKNPRQTQQWQFWIDRGGTFTDVIAIRPNGEISTKKLLSENPEAYQDSALQAIREYLEIDQNTAIPANQIKAIKMGTTVATNALLERKGEPTVLAITQGLQDIIEIGHQARPDIFALNIEKAALLYEHSIGITERISAKGEIKTALDVEATHKQLQSLFDQGYRSIAIVLMHGFQFPEHEIAVANIASEVGFTQISTSHEVSPLTKIVPRGETTIVDAYLTPILHQYVNRVSNAIDGNTQAGKLLFMQSSGGLTDASKFRGRDAILSGPAGGIVGATHTAKIAGFEKIIGFDMGGTSTDVSHFAGEYEKSYETQVAGVNMRVPMMHIHTVAAGGGSLLSYDGSRFRVGPESAGANPGPVCYRRDGQLAVTDINVCLGKIQPDHFPAIFGPDQNQPLDQAASVAAFEKIAHQLGDDKSPEQVADGFLDIAIEHMAQAIKKISVARGYNLKDYTLNCFGGAGGQHACLVAERLGMSRVFLHPLSGVLSAYGMGLADISVEKQQTFEHDLNDSNIEKLSAELNSLIQKNTSSLIEQGLSTQQVSHQSWAFLRYQGSDTSLKVSIDSASVMREMFEAEHQRQYGFTAENKSVEIEMIGVTSFGGGETPPEHKQQNKTEKPAEAIDHRAMFSKGQWYNTPIYKIENLSFGHVISGPAIITEPTGTVIIESDWQAKVTEYQHLVLEHTAKQTSLTADQVQIQKDPVTLEIFNNLFMSIAEQMGIVLRNTSQSVNIKERLDFSCAIFDQDGNLVANAPHVPVHLGSMDTSIKVIINSGKTIRAGDVFVQNNPYNGGSHLPDITVITPVFDNTKTCPIFYVASRAHHEDIGGIAPGSMSPLGTNIHEEGILLDSVKLVDQGRFLYDEIHQILSSGKYPARKVDQNIADLMAQIAANNAGVNELNKLIDEYTLPVVHAYMGFIQDSAEQAVRSAIKTLTDSQFELEVDSGAKIKIVLRVNSEDGTATIDFTGTSEQQNTNFNAPGAVTQAAVLYVFRCLVNDSIPLNAGCMKPIKLVIPEGSILNPQFPAAVVAGNVEVSQAVTNALFGALGILGSSQGTMNNLTFGDDEYQYYETICSGAPAGPDFDGASAVHTHMTNTRLTDPEILESRYPVMLDEFSIRRGSGGKGKHNAGDGVLRKIRFLKEMSLSVLSDHRRIAPFGSNGGGDGEIGRNWIVRADSTIETLDSCAQADIKTGDTIVISTPTGGGFGKTEADKQ